MSTGRNGLSEVAAKFLVGCLVVALTLPGCGVARSDKQQIASGSESVSIGVLEDSLSDPASIETRTLISNAVYTRAIDRFSIRGYLVERVDTVYVSAEYLEETAYNSQSNLYFGYTLAELEEEFKGTKYVFTVNESGGTSVHAFEDYDNYFDGVVSDLAVGGGVILVCVTLSAVTGPAAPAVSMIFACAAKGATLAGISGGAISGLTAGVMAGIESGNPEEALKAATVAVADGFKWGAITGALAGGASEAVGLKYASSQSALRGRVSGITMNEAAQIQRESHYPLDVIGQISSMQQYEALKAAGLKTSVRPVAGRSALLRDIDVNYRDEFGTTNLERMRGGYAPLDSNGYSYELHHLAQDPNGTLAVLTRQEHRGKGNFSIWHLLDESDVNHGAEWTKLRQDFWKDAAALVDEGLV